MNVGIAKERPWVLSIIKSASMVSQPEPPRLAFFHGQVLDLARTYDMLASTGPASEKRFHRCRVVDLWSLFPCFCKSPSDIEAALPPLSETLSRAICDKRYLELTVSQMDEYVMQTRQVENSTYHAS